MNVTVLDTVVKKLAQATLGTLTTIEFAHHFGHHPDWRPVAVGSVATMFARGIGIHTNPDTNNSNVRYPPR